ncbi:Protein unc-13-like protein C [Frankliniella fusca]|uniref:Protein unc-13-like protein C n=1 Tax=Frankliniella fusca TaxID=407009 RepID=A0AAE1I3N0_9NEOP|nr:Protein unc-13-like protein C [Frankliniella fusca]
MTYLKSKQLCSFEERVFFPDLSSVDGKRRVLRYLDVNVYRREKQIAMCIYRAIDTMQCKSTHINICFSITGSL